MEKLIEELIDKLTIACEQEATTLLQNPGAKDVRLVLLLQGKILAYDHCIKELQYLLLRRAECALKSFVE
jgi:hypothetical protein